MINIPVEVFDELPTTAITKCIALAKTFNIHDVYISSTVNGWDFVVDASSNPNTVLQHYKNYIEERFKDEF